jgi:hypothetical protein
MEQVLGPREESNLGAVSTSPPGMIGDAP